MKLGRTTAGSPISSSQPRASSTLRTVLPRGTSRPILCIACLKPLAALGLVDHVGIGADHLDAVLFEHAVPPQVHRHVEPRLPAERRQQRIGPLLLDHLGDDLPRERLDVRAIGRRRIGHDRGRVRVHQHDLVALFAQRLAGLRAGVVELARLPDDDRAGADDENLLEVVASWHQRGFLILGSFRDLRRQFSDNDLFTVVEHLKLRLKS